MTNLLACKSKNQTDQIFPMKKLKYMIIMHMILIVIKTKLTIQTDLKILVLQSIINKNLKMDGKQW